jgi:hypothetical protein
MASPELGKMQPRNGQVINCARAKRRSARTLLGAPVIWGVGVLAKPQLSMGNAQNNDDL